MNKTLKSRIQNKRGTDAEWKLATNFVPLKGEQVVYEADSDNESPRIKIGDGNTNVNSLPFAEDVARLSSIPNSATVRSANFAMEGEGGTVGNQTYEYKALGWAEDDVLNLEDGEGEYSIKQKEADISTGGSDRSNYTYGRANAAFGHKNRTYQRDSFAFGGGNIVGDPSGDTNAYTFTVVIGESNTNIKTRSSLVVGNTNNGTCQSSIIVGSNNTSNNGANTATFGGSNHNNASFSLCSGFTNSVDDTASYSFIGGKNCNIYHENSFVFGDHVRSTNKNTFSIGRYNGNNPSALFAVGNGHAKTGSETSDIYKTAFEVLQDGRAKVQSAPKDNDDVIRKQELDALSTKALGIQIDASLL